MLDLLDHLIVEHHLRMFLIREFIYSILSNRYRFQWVLCTWPRQIDSLLAQLNVTTHINEINLVTNIILKLKLVLHSIFLPLDFFLHILILSRFWNSLHSKIYIPCTARSYFIVIWMEIYFCIIIVICHLMIFNLSTVSMLIIMLAIYFFLW